MNLLLLGSYLKINREGYLKSIANEKRRILFSLPVPALIHHIRNIPNIPCLGEKELGSKLSVSLFVSLPLPTLSWCENLTFSGLCFPNDRLWCGEWNCSFLTPWLVNLSLDHSGPMGWVTGCRCPWQSECKPMPHPPSMQVSERKRIHFSSQCKQHSPKYP